MSMPHAPFIAAMLVLSAATVATANPLQGSLDDCRRSARGSTYEVASSDLGLDELSSALEQRRAAARLDRVPLSDLAKIEDFHPETDRWTEHNNRIRISMWLGAWLLSNELDIHNDVVVGFRIAWEVPGFIAIRWDSGFVPWARLEVKRAFADTRGNPRSSREVSGVVHAHTLSLGIFNPELSVDGLAFWAGFGAGLWIYDFSEDDTFASTEGGGGSGFDNVDFQEVEIGANIFLELDYKISDIFHVSLGFRQHFILADHTDEGRFYDINGSSQSTDSGRNDGALDDLAGVTELTLAFSVLF
jgi:hypothetical protein